MPSQNRYVRALYKVLVTFKIHFSGRRPGLIQNQKKKINFVRLFVCLFVCHQKSTPPVQFEKNVQNMNNFLVFCFKGNVLRLKTRINSKMPQNLLRDTLKVFSDNIEKVPPPVQFEKTVKNREKCLCFSFKPDIFRQVTKSNHKGCRHLFKEVSHVFQNHRQTQKRIEHRVYIFLTQLYFRNVFPSLEL